MQIAIRIRTAVLLALALLPLAPPAAALDLIEGAIENARIHFIGFNSAHQPTRIKATGCPRCPRTFVLVDDVKLLAGPHPIPPGRMMRYEGQPATVIYDMESGYAVGVYWQSSARGRGR